MTNNIDTTLRAHIESGEVLGLVWLVARGNDVRSGALGHFDEQRSKPIAPDTIFRISSMSKPVTAAVAMTLVDDGTLALGEPADRWLPELADRRVLRDPRGAVDDTVPATRPITVDDLLTFRLGWGGDFTDFTRKPFDDAVAALELGVGPPQPAVPPPPDEWMRRMGTLPLQYQPGERWLYHTGSDILGVLIARASGRPFPDVLTERLLEPLGMEDTAFFVPPTQLHRFGTCFTSDADGQRTIYDPPDGQWSVAPAFPGGGAGLASTVVDYYRFADMLRRGGERDSTRVLSEPSVAAMTTNQLTSDQLSRGAPSTDGATGWGLGMGVQITSDGELSVGAYGWDGGLGSVWRNDPRRDLVGILLTNETWSSPVPPPVARSFWSAVRGGTLAG